MRFLYFDLIKHHWLLQASLVFLLTLTADIIGRFFLKHLHNRLKKTRTFWDNIIVDALRAPLSLSIWVVGSVFALQIALAEAFPELPSYLVLFKRIGFVISATWFLFGLIKRGERNLSAQAKKRGKTYDQTTADALGKVLRFCVISASSLILLQTLGFSISGILAFGGIGGIAVGFASKDMLANFFGAITIYWDRPFKVGDWIRSPDKEIEGIVEQIGWRVTCVRKLDKRPMYIPNAVFSTITVENPSRMTHRKIVETVGVRYCDAAVLPKILADIRHMLQKHPEIDTTQNLLAYFTTYGPSSMDVLISAYTQQILLVPFHQVKEDILFKIHAIVSSHGAEMAFPTTTIYLGDEDQKIQTYNTLSQTDKPGNLPQKSQVLLNN